MFEQSEIAEQAKLIERMDEKFEYLRSRVEDLEDGLAVTRRRQEIDLDATLSKSGLFVSLRERVNALEDGLAITQRCLSPLHCKCGRYVGVWVDDYVGCAYRWYNRGKEPGQSDVICQDCLTECHGDGTMKQLQRTGKAK